MNLKKYEEIRPSIKAGDLIAFDGKNLFSEIIKKSTGSRFSHLAICMGFNPLIMGQQHSLLLCESLIYLDKTDDITGEITRGVQIHRASTRLATTDADCWWIPLKESLTLYGEEQMFKWLFKKHSQKIDYDFKQGIGSVIDWWNDTWIYNLPDFDKLFCSELIGRAYQKAGVLNPDLNASEMHPQDIVELPILGPAVKL